MQLIISIEMGSEVLELPIAHHHILQSVYYRLMSEDGAETALHDHGFSYGTREYKLFTFGPIQGRYAVHGKRITFTGRVTMEFRSVDNDVVTWIARNAIETGIMFGDHWYRNVRCEVRNDLPGMLNPEYVIVMQSPICVYHTDPISRKTQYLNPLEDEFYVSILDNFRRKYKAYFGTFPDSDIEIAPECIGPRDKILTRYENFVIEAYRGRYRIKGDPSHIGFLYDTGLGAKNSQGFGMFTIER